MLPYVDSSLPTKSFIQGSKYVNKMISRYFKVTPFDNSPTIDTITDQQLKQMLDNIRTKNNELFTTNSLNYILSIVKRANSRITLTSREFPKKYKITELTQSDELAIQNAVISLIDNFLKNLEPTLEFVENNRVNIDTALCAFLCIATGLRSSELLQLSMQHYKQILDSQPVAIRIKKRVNSIIIVANIEFLSVYYDTISTICKLRNIESNMPLITTSIVAINNTLRTFIIDTATFNNLTLNIDNFGFQCVRKMNTTIIIAKTGNIHLAKLFNRHNNITTTQFYNTKNFMTTKLNTIFMEM